MSRRRVFYIPGYDPIPPRRYRELYRRESAEQAGISGYQIDVKAAPGETAWRVRARIDGAETVSKVDVLVWSDLVRSSMRQNIPRTYLALIRTAWVYLSTGTLRRLSWLGKGPVIAALYPVVMLLLQLLSAFVLAGVLASVAAWAALEAGAALRNLIFGEGPAGWVATLVAAAVFWAVFLPVTLGVLRWWRAQDDRTFAYYLMNDFAYSASRRGAWPPEVEARLHEFRHRIEAAMAEDIDEVLVVGHSSGAALAVSVVADMIRLKSVADDGRGPSLSLLTLGQVIPMISFLPDATRLRRDLRLLSTAEEIAWVDVSAPGDGCCFALSDPVSVSGVAPAKGQQWPLILSAAFSKTLSPEKREGLRWRYFRTHFQYLCAFDRPGDYDYFQITAGPQTLGQRYRGRKTSPSRIDVPASRFTSTAI